MKVFSPVCVLKWLSKWLLCDKVFSQVLHWYGLSYALYLVLEFIIFWMGGCWLSHPWCSHVIFVASEASDFIFTLIYFLPDTWLPPFVWVIFLETVGGNFFRALRRQNSAPNLGSSLRYNNSLNFCAINLKFGIYVFFLGMQFLIF